MYCSQAMPNFISCIFILRKFWGGFVARSKYYIFIHNGILEIKYSEDMQSNLIYIKKKVQI